MCSANLSASCRRRAVLRRPLCPCWPGTKVSGLLSHVFPWLTGMGPASSPTLGLPDRPAGALWSRASQGSNGAAGSMTSRARSGAPSCAGALCTCSTCMLQPSSTPRAHQHPPVCMHGVAPKRRHKAQGLACSCLGGCVGPRRRGIGVAYPRMPARVRAPDPAWHPHLKHLPKSQASSRLHLCLSHRPGQVEASMERQVLRRPSSIVTPATLSWVSSSLSLRGVAYAV